MNRYYAGSRHPADGIRVQNEAHVTRATRALAGSTSLLATLLAADISSQQPAAPQSAAPTAKPEEGIPVTDQTVQKACGSCHRPDDKGQMSRISFQRNTPEGWQSTI